MASARSRDLPDIRRNPCNHGGIRQGPLGKNGPCSYLESMTAAGEHGLTGTLLLGPGERLAPLAPLLAALPHPESGPRVWLLEDVEGLLDPPTRAGLALIDADELDIEDLGIVRRFLDRAPEWALVLTGQDAGSHVARALGTRAAFLAWPLDVEQLQDLLASAEHLEELDDEEEVDDVIDAPRPAYIPTPEEEEEMAEIEAILKAGGDEHDSPETDTLARDAEDFLDALESEVEDEEEDEFEEEHVEQPVVEIPAVAEDIEESEPEPDPTAIFIQKPKQKKEKKIDQVEVAEPELESVPTIGWAWFEGDSDEHDSVDRLDDVEDALASITGGDWREDELLRTPDEIPEEIWNRNDSWWGGGSSNEPPQPRTFDK